MYIAFDRGLYRADKSFYKMIKETGVPMGHSRWCCGIFKEGGISPYLHEIDNVLLFLEMRNEESSTRSNYKDLWKNIQWNNDTWQGVLPIRKWNELEIWLYIIHNNIPINSKYKKGYQRVGCHIACPFYTTSTWILDEYYYKKQYGRIQ